ncbi:MULTISPECIES: hypothetical protein [unclassified Streptomyces]|nr:MULTISPECIES: hypothetical protein [unclassified Streptomyces]WSP60371.1 hypothetical protein OG306_02880 [Streptomyces sp. NBC_01241]WSU26764.1 hypothetical protein OG508_36490 [Streptomyces sp. NBC_01108]MCX4784833.1 hypothetical protein [Streptomyces sp. NBC_01221]MCX4799214.1 hypothetical protein [Streptomyces sp. NBC_01242]WSJ41355.1 hypothetical protein OG772_33435 [Streptomyces sp. NBC_01321]
MTPAGGARIQKTQRCRWVTDSYAHDGVRADAEALDRLIAMARDEA